MWDEMASIKVLQLMGFHGFKPFFTEKDGFLLGFPPFSELHLPGSRSRGWTSCLSPLENTKRTTTLSTCLLTCLLLIFN